MCKRRNETGQMKREEYESQGPGAFETNFSWSPPELITVGSAAASVKDCNGVGSIQNSNEVQMPKRQIVRAIRRPGPSKIN